MLLSEDWRPFIFGAFCFLEIYGTPGVSIFIGQSGRIYHLRWHLYVGNGILTDHQEY
jgi:hypothetical protein